MADDSIGLVLFLAALDISIVSTALPTIAEELNATPSEFSWVGTVSLEASWNSSVVIRDDSRDSFLILLRPEFVGSASFLKRANRSPTYSHRRL